VQNAHVGWYILSGANKHHVTYDDPCRVDGHKASITQHKGIPAIALPTPFFDAKKVELNRTELVALVLVQALVGLDG
jgi:hypothetical protein